MWRLAFALVAAALWVVPAYAAAAKHSGDLVRVKSDALTVQEMGPWSPKRQITLTRTFDLTPATKVELVTRAKTVAGGAWAGGFAKSPLPVSDLKPGDYVTVTASKEGKKLIAESVQVIRPTAD